MKNAIYLLVTICLAEAVVIALFYFGVFASATPATNENADLLTTEEWMKALEDDAIANQRLVDAIDPEYFDVAVSEGATGEEQIALLQKMNPAADNDYAALSPEELLAELTIELVGKETHLMRNVYNSLTESQKRFLIHLYNAQIEVSTESDIDEYFAPMLTDVNGSKSQTLPENWEPADADADEEFEEVGEASEAE